jgi:hypothetical protein
MGQENTQLEVEKKVTATEVANVVCVEEYENNEAFLRELGEVFKKDYGIELTRKELEESGRNLSALLSHFL